MVIEKTFSKENWYSDHTDKKTKGILSNPTTFRSLNAMENMYITNKHAPTVNTTKKEDNTTSGVFLKCTIFSSMIFHLIAWVAPP
jgi:hypothetical protein